ncbi:MAG: hypothetical protein BMS9Abin36_2139 [Gammaproteobacteria bacterium]|nr:MAG: hypothetical protein BMS9Abin36_2139 [Gammaproteobacteria bacterium]
MQQISKSQFKPKALEVMRKIEQTGEPVIITDHGRPTLELKVYTPADTDPLEQLKGSVVEYKNPTQPVVEDDWEAAR